MTNNSLPPNPQHAVLNTIYPWDEYNKTITTQWLYEQAQKTGFIGTFEDFKLRYGAYISAADPQDLYDLIENYSGTYHITPLISIEQVLKTKNKVLNQDIVIDPIPETALNPYQTYSGRYVVTPMADVAQQLRTKDKVLEDNIVIDKIPYIEVSNEAGGNTVIIG